MRLSRTGWRWSQILGPLLPVPLGCYLLYKAIESFNRSPPPIADDTGTVLERVRCRDGPANCLFMARGPMIHIFHFSTTATNIVVQVQTQVRLQHMHTPMQHEHPHRVRVVSQPLYPELTYKAIDFSPSTFARNATSRGWTSPGGSGSGGAAR